MKRQLDQFLKNETKLQGALIGISIRCAESGKILYEHMSQIRLHPASNMKLLTAAAALNVLGEDYRFSTELKTDGSMDEGILQGNLYLVGKGDPTLLPSDFEKFASKVREQGITEINGDIIGDDKWYDDIRLSADLNWSDEHYYYGSQISALTVSPNEDFDSGSVIVEVAPGAVGEPPAVHVSPETDYILVFNEAISAEAAEEDELIITREHGGNIITVHGAIGAGEAVRKEWISVWEPTGYALDLFQRALKRQGISWTGTVKTRKAPIEAELLFFQQSMTLSKLLIPFMKLSNNGHGEVLIKEMGKIVHGEGSWEKGIEVLEKEMIKLGMNQDTMVIRDGSGISHGNLIPANEISTLLYAMQREGCFQAFLNSLPNAGKEERMVGGTLRERMNRLTVQAKTGTILGVSTLSGYAETKNGENLIFSIMINNLLDEEEGKDIEDRLLEIIINNY
ncbi:D-alanyl-D-alanine carboxypeptidase/D-alanyl-D-alanine-endopeptidase [Virgibacillus profundi]|uniref:D-alanyl-D-alanine carboxypeptidase/D-alanyl-D-alanine-endopeptidase n=1 Tax=Virgibacillus profundi TaxID=2024555 RepID=A0A2A2ICF9_9BACI|nr:D-alanyl-D-alanine carboxypeptidase/D-alanyl-D-alanine-endopeptidase [Virgibacillus profundi]PAV28835.1 D-alanyl-D-alanine carboxypeptidase/D-alanyl-D-alanine-endopeptidase [Virgibacillus profundi]PXY53003.1 D-alanyl-D-alanine carboxypeptidase/D-alanyl-D-alanine-endopeptidase [Virgibacillus profundi]